MKRHLLIALIVIAAFAIGLLRPQVATIASPLGFQIYKDLAHVFMGALLVLWLTSWGDLRAQWRWTFWILNLVEVVCSAHSKGLF